MPYLHGQTVVLKPAVRHIAAVLTCSCGAAGNVNDDVAA